MKPQTRLSKILQMEDSSIKLSRLYSFCFKILYQCPLWYEAHNEITRLQNEGYKLSDIVPEK